MSIIKAFGGKSVNRAPRGGFSHPVNGKSYKGGQFCPLYAVAGGSDDATPAVLPVAEFVSQSRGCPAGKLVCEHDVDIDGGAAEYTFVVRSYGPRGNLIHESYRIGGVYDSIPAAAAAFEASVARVVAADPSRRLDRVR